jgi:predicted RNA binding protein YcfA (HicA-like mRNA interferase family)
LRLPRDLSGRELIRLLSRYGYEQARQVGSHIRIRSILRGYPHHVTVPDQSELRLGTLNAILSDVAQYLGLERATLAEEIFAKRR